MASCTAVPGPQLAELAHTIAYGQVTRVERAGQDGTAYTFEAARLHKGAPPNPLVVVEPEITSLSYRMQAGEAHTLYLRLGRDRTYWTTADCSGSHPGPPTAAEIALLGPGSPAPAPGAPPPTAPPPVRIWIPLIAFTVALGAVAAALFLPRALRKPGQ